MPNDPENYYRKLDLVPPDLRGDLEKTKIVITNYHAFQLREHTAAASLTKSILIQDKDVSPFTETPDQMVRRVCRELGNKKNIIAINDEAHHCYRRKPNADEEKYSGDDRKEAQKNEREAKVWISGLEAIQQKIGIRAVYDLSATPFYLKGSGYREGTLFPWVVSDFSLIDAIESGIVKIPRVPVADDSMKGELPTYRNIWALIRDHLPKKGRSSKDNVPTTPEPKLPKELEGALQSLYSNYEKYYQKWLNNDDSVSKGLTPPVFIVVCNNTSVSKMVYDYIAGWDTGKKYPDDRPVLAPGKLALFGNVEGDRWSSRPNTILIDSEQLESGDAMTDEFKKLAKHQIEEFKQEIRERFPGRDPEAIADEELLREVMNTVGKAGKLGEQVRCVVSVSMLTEGWDCGTVTHILGVRAFGTQLLCEQVMGRALRRISYAHESKEIAVNSATVTIDAFDPEYAEVYGVPFAFIPCAGSQKKLKPGILPTRVRALPEREHLAIAFPRLLGYRYEIGRTELKADFDNPGCRYTLSTENLPTTTINAPIVGESSIHTLDELRSKREQEVAFLLAKLTLEKYFRDDGQPKTERSGVHKFDADVQAWLFPQVLAIAKEWLKVAVTYKAKTYPQMLLLYEFAHDAADCIYQAIAAGEPIKKIKPILRPYEAIGSTCGVDFDTSRPVYITDGDRCHISHVVADTDSWEQKMAQVLESMDEVVCYVKNQGLGFFIPYTYGGQQRNYQPDFIVRVNDGREDLLNLIVEVSGEARADKAAKVSTAKELWLSAINGYGDFGRWEFINITDPWDAENTIKGAISSGKFDLR
jgi:type III restriction enzyme